MTRRPVMRNLELETVWPDIQRRRSRRRGTRRRFAGWPDDQRRRSRSRSAGRPDIQRCGNWSWRRSGQTTSGNGDGLTGGQTCSQEEASLAGLPLNGGTGRGEPAWAPWSRRGKRRTFLGSLWSRRGKRRARLPLSISPRDWPPPPSSHGNSGGLQ